LVDVGGGDYAVEVTDERYLFAEHFVHGEVLGLTGVEDALREIRRVQSGELQEWVWNSNSMYTTVRSNETTLDELYENEETHRVATEEFADFLARVIAAVDTA
jgi:hypothetical protein